LKNIADNGILNMVVSFFSDEDAVAVKAKVDQAALEPKAVQPKTMVMQNADQAYSRDYGQAVINKAAKLPANTVAANDATYLPSTASNALTAQPKAMTEREAANEAFKFTSQRLPAVPTDTAAPLNLESQARSQALINNALPSKQSNAVTNSAINTAQSNAATSSAVNAVQNNVAPAAIVAQPRVMTEREAANDAFKFTSQRLPAVPTDTAAPLNLESQARSQALINNALPSKQSNAVTNSAINTAQSNAATSSAVNAVQNNVAPAAIVAQPRVMTEREAANDAFKFTSQRLPAVPTDTAAPLNLESQALSQTLINNAVTPAANDVANSTSATTANINSSAINSALQNSTANNFTNAANSPIFSSSQAQLSGVKQTVSPLQPLPTAKTDQAITNTANNSAYKVDQLSTEQQQQSNSYKAKVQKSAFLQNLTSNTHNSSSSDSDNRKSVHIETVNFKSDDLAQSFEQMMELAG
jgi:hypothetical protein